MGWALALEVLSCSLWGSALEARFVAPWLPSWIWPSGFLVGSLLRAPRVYFCALIAVAFPSGAPAASQVKKKRLEICKDENIV